MVLRRTVAIHSIQQRCDWYARSDGAGNEVELEQSRPESEMEVEKKGRNCILKWVNLLEGECCKATFGKDVDYRLI